MTNSNYSKPSPISNYRIAVLISGRGSNLQSLIKSLSDNIEIAVVVSDNKNAIGLQLAQKAKIKTLIVERRYKEITNIEFNLELVRAIRPFTPSLIVLAGFMRVVTGEFIDAFDGNVINIHPSLLPSFRGLHAQSQALQAGVKYAGCTVHYVSAEVDAGPIIAQAVVPVFQSDSLEDLEKRILAEEHKLLPAAVQGIANGRIKLDRNNTCVSIDKQITNDKVKSLLSLKTEK